MAGPVTAKKYTIADDESPKFMVGDEFVTPEAEAAAHPPIAAARQTIANIIPNEEAYRRDPRLRNIHLSVSPAEALKREENYDEAGQLITATQIPFAAGAVRSIVANPRTIIPIARGIAKAAIGTTAGRYVGRDIGGIVGHPEAGAAVGGIAGGIYGGMGGKVPTKMSILRSIASEEPAAAEAATLKPIATETEPPVSLGTAPPRSTKPLTPIESAEVKPIAQPQPIPTGRVTPKTLKGYFNPGRSEPVKLDQLIDRAAGVKPLRPDVPLREQLTSAPAPTLEEVDPIKVKYPDPAVRQMVRANGEGIVEAVGKGKPELMKQLHDLTRVELRQALVNAGEDMGQTTVSNSKFAGEGSIPREEAFNRLLKRGVKPEQIADLAKKTSEPGFKGGINVRGAEASMKSPDTETNIRSLSAEIDTMKTKLRNAGARPKGEKDALQKQIDDYQARLDELRKKAQ